MTKKNQRIENAVAAALEAGASVRRNSLVPHSQMNPTNADAQQERIERAIALVETVAAGMDADDLSAIETVCLTQALALDVIFEQFALSSARGDILFHDPMRMALKAQSQCRATFKMVMSLRNPRPLRNPSKRTIENAKILVKPEG